MNDYQALEMCNQLKHDILKMPPFEAQFILMPLMHSELMSDQEECVKLLKELVSNAD